MIYTEEDKYHTSQLQHYRFSDGEYEELIKDKETNRNKLLLGLLPTALKTLSRYSISFDDGWDVAIDTTYKCIEKTDPTRPFTDMRNYIITNVRFAVLDFLRKQKQEDEVPETVPIYEPFNRSKAQEVLFAAADDIQEALTIKTPQANYRLSDLLLRYLYPVHSVYSITTLAEERGIAYFTVYEKLLPLLQLLPKHYMVKNLYAEIRD